MQRYLYYCFLLLFISANSYNSYSTHLRAGDITATVISLPTRTYKFTLTLYRDMSGVDQPNATLNFGDGTKCITVPVNTPREQVSPSTEKLTYTFQHSFAGDGEYLISFNEENRNPEINNINDGNSVLISFYIETLLVIDAFNGINNTPVLLIPPVDLAAKGQIFLHNPGAFDPDGDSLAYIMVTPRAYSQGAAECDGGRPFTVPNYRNPADPFFNGLKESGGPATFTLDPYTGDLVWNTPGKPGLYNVAFQIEEWRKINGEWVKLGFVTRDMQINVKDTNNKRPILTIPKDTCIVAKSSLNEIIKAIDPDKNPIFISSYSGVYTLKESPADFTGGIGYPLPTPSKLPVAKPSPTQETFTWNTTCSHIREKPYQVIFKAQDKPGSESIPSLVDFKTWNITVVGPPPKGLAVKQSSSAAKAIEVTWSLYECTNASKILVYRKEGPYNFTPTNCQLGIPEGSGYQLIGKVNSNNTGFLDKQNLKRGVKYCYRLVAEFPRPGGGLSYASTEVCTELKLDAPVITNVTVDKTNEQTGQITVKWTRPLELDKLIYPGPYQYRIYRSTGLTGQQNLAMVATKNSITDTTFVDTNLNTQRNAYNYQVLFYNNNFLLDSSDVASSVRLSAAGGVNSIKLSWTYETPWFNTDFHIYREDRSTGVFNLIDSTSAQVYTDIGKGGINLIPEEEYCYKIVSKGTYFNPKIKAPLINFSQIVCQSPLDTIAPCPPILSILPVECEDFNVSIGCNSKDYFNTLYWTDSTGGICDDDISYYKLYYAFSKDTTLFDVIVTNVMDTFFLHKDNRFFYAGCYAVTAVDRSGNESPYSNVVCNDNCPFLMLPNVITPNGDDKNQSFKPFAEDGNCPRFIESIEFVVVNRWGNVVYDSKKEKNTKERQTFIDWDGRMNSGKELATGVYFYEAKVKFIALDPKKANQTFKGWIQVLK